jgi:hypothetical protein
MLTKIAIVISLRTVVADIDNGNYTYLFFGQNLGREVHLAFTSPNQLPVQEDDRFVADVVADCQLTELIGVHGNFGWKYHSLFCNARSVSYGSTIYFSNTWPEEKK